MGFLRLATGEGSLVGEVQVALLNRSDISSARCVTALNFAQTEISRLHDFRELKQFYSVATFFTASVFNDKFIPLAPLTKHIHTAILRNGAASRKLVQKPWRMFDAMWPSPESYGRAIPAWYSRWNNQVILYPVPNQVYPIFMRITTYPRPFDLSVPEAVSDFDQKDDILIKLASAYLWGGLGRVDKKSEIEREIFGPNLGKIGGMLGTAVKEDSDMPDLDISADFDAGSGQYWADPFMRRSP